MKIYLATDHAGFFLKEKIKVFLNTQKIATEDLGAYEFDPNDNYPDFIKKAGLKISQNPKEKAIILGGSGQGEAILANKFKNVRCVVFYGPVVPIEAIDAEQKQSSDPYEILKLTRAHNDANILSFGARFLNEEQALKAVQIWLNTNFSNLRRHSARIEEIAKIEKANGL